MQGSGFRVQGSRFRVHGSRSKVQGSGFGGGSVLLDTRAGGGASEARHACADVRVAPHFVWVRAAHVTYIDRQVVRPVPHTTQSHISPTILEYEDDLTDRYHLLLDRTV